MSKRRWRSRVSNIESSDEDEAAAAPPAPAASRRSALQLSQSTAGDAPPAANSGLAALLAGSGPASSGGAGPAAAAAAANGSRRRGRAVQQKALVAGPAGNAGGSANGGSRQAHAAAAAGQLWVEKYAPRTDAELAVHKKKVQEVREWLEQQRASLGQAGVRRLLVVAGPPGCGKSAVLTALAASLGFDVSEWRPPSSVGGDEAQHAGMQRRSKLEEFNEFVVRTKMPHLSLSSGGGAPKPNQPPSSSVAAAAGKASQTSAAARASQLSAATAAAAKPSQPLALATAAAAIASQRPAPAFTAPAAAAGSSQQQGSQARPGRLPPSLLPTLVLVDDLPHATGPDQRHQVAEALADLAASARFPVAVVATETSGKAQQEKGLSAAAGSYKGLHKELLAVLEAHGAVTISFNPFTTLVTAKVLRGILEHERLALPEADVLAIAEQANGDLHNAISTLQFVCTGTAAAAAPSKPKPRARGTKRKAVGGSKAAAGADSAAAGAGGSGGGATVAQASQVGYARRDSSLSLFHALGKLLYNKRLPAAPVSQQPASGSLPSVASQPPSQPPQLQQQRPQFQQQQAGNGQGSGTQPWTAHSFWQQAVADVAAPAATRPVAAWAQRKPMEFDPEAVLAAAGLEAGSVAAFLHENLLHFIDDVAIEDAAGCLEALSACDVMASGRRWGCYDDLMEDEDTASATLLDATAASTAARGVCFHNAHPAPRRWLPLKAPALYVAARGQAANAEQLSQQAGPAWAVEGGMGALQSNSSLAAELLPYARKLASAHHPGLQRLHPPKWSRFWNGQLYEEQEEVAAGGGLAPVPAAEDGIEECTDEDDW